MIDHCHRCDVVALSLFLCCVKQWPGHIRQGIELQIFLEYLFLTSKNVEGLLKNLCLNKNKQDWYLLLWTVTVALHWTMACLRRLHQHDRSLTMSGSEWRMLSGLSRDGVSVWYSENIVTYYKNIIILQYKLYKSIFILYYVKDKVTEGVRPLCSVLLPVEKTSGNFPVPWWK